MYAQTFVNECMSMDVGVRTLARACVCVFTRLVVNEDLGLSEISVSAKVISAAKWLKFGTKTS